MLFRSSTYHSDVGCHAPNEPTEETPWPEHLLATAKDDDDDVHKYDEMLPFNWAQLLEAWQQKKRRGVLDNGAAGQAAGKGPARSQTDLRAALGRARPVLFCRLPFLRWQAPSLRARKARARATPRASSVLPARARRAPLEALLPGRVVAGPQVRARSAGAQARSHL